MLIAVTVACKKDKSNTIDINGFVKDKDSQLSLANMNVYAVVYKTGKGMGIVDGSHEQDLGTVLTDGNGHFSIQGKQFSDAEAVKFIIYPKDSDRSTEIRIQLNDLSPEKMPITLLYNSR